MVRVENIKIRTIILITVLFFALVIRIFLSSATIIWSDAASYFNLAENITRGLKIESTLGFDAFIQPGYSFFIYIFNFFVNNSELASHVVSLVSSILSILIIYLLTKKLFGFKVAILSSILFSLSPLAIWYSGATWTESLFTFIFVGIIYFTWLILEKGKNYAQYFALGVLVGVSYYVRTVGISASLAIMFWLFIYCFFVKKIGTKRFFASLIILVMGAAITISPYLIFLYREKGHFVITGQQDYAIALKSELGSARSDTEKERHQFLYRLNTERTDYQINQEETIAKNKLDLGIYFKDFFSNLKHNIIFVISSFAFQIILIALAFYYGRRYTFKLFYLLSWIPFYLILYYSGKPYLRYYFPLTPVILIITSLGIICILRKLPVGLKGLILIFTLVIFVSYQYIVAVSNYHQLEPLNLFEETEVKKAGLRFKEQFGENHNILSTMTLGVYWAGGKYYPLPVDDYESILEFARNRNIGYLLLYEQRDRDIRPKLNHLYEVTENKDLKLLLKENEFYFYQIK